MSRETRSTDTEFGSADVGVAVCDTCAIVRAVANSWYTADGWYQVRCTEPAPDPTRAGERRERDFCTVGCMIAYFAPGYFDVDPDQVKRALQGLEKIENDLGSTKEKAGTPIPY
jgi:hypothetical protein